MPGEENGVDHTLVKLAWEELRMEEGSGIITGRFGTYRKIAACGINGMGLFLAIELAKVNNMHRKEIVGFLPVSVYTEAGTAK